MPASRISVSAAMFSATQRLPNTSTKSLKTNVIQKKKKQNKKKTKTNFEVYHF